jgi:hypothetical protein
MRLVHFSATVLCIWLPACSSKIAAPHSEGEAARPKPAQRVRAEGGTKPAFERTLELQRTTFKVSCGNAESVKRLKIVPSGLEV